MNDIYKLSGSALDDAIAEKILGYTIRQFIFAYDGWERESRVWKDSEGNSHNPKPYSTDISAAWEVWEKICKMDGMFASIHGRRVVRIEYTDGRLNFDVIAENISEAICRAALMALDQSKEGRNDQATT